MSRPKDVLLVVETSRAYGRGVVRGITRYIREHADWTVHFEDQGFVRQIPGWIRDWNGDGIISRTAHPTLGRILLQKKCPVVELLGDGKHVIAEITTDGARAAAMASGHFLERGLRHFGFYSFGSAWWIDVRRRAFVDALREHGFDCHVLTEQDDRRSETSFYPDWKAKYETRLFQWLAKLPKPVGIWMPNDSQAIRVHQASLKGGFRIPEDVAILGADNDVVICEALTPPLSSIRIDSFRVGYEAARLLERKMSRRNVKKPVPLWIPPIDVVMRRSTDVIATGDEDVVEAVRIIRQRAVHGLSVEELSETLSIAKRTLLRKFRQHFNRTVAAEIHRVRMENARLLLRETRLGMAAVAEASGFRSLEYFIKTFRRTDGISPKDYRASFE